MKKIIELNPKFCIGTELKFKAVCPFLREHGCNFHKIVRIVYDEDSKNFLRHPVCKFHGDIFIIEVRDEIPNNSIAYRIARFLRKMKSKLQG